jgi:hypothetical protein
MNAPLDCGIAHPQDGYTCGRLGTEVCCDCGTSLCNSHAESCESCLKVFCGCCLYFHAKESHLRRPSIAPFDVFQRRSA